MNGLFSRNSYFTFLGQSLPTPSAYRNFIWEGSGANYVLPYFTLFDRDIKHNEGNCIQLDEYVAGGFTLFKFSLGE